MGNGNNKTTIKVLVVDDTLATRERFCSLLSEQEGIEVFGCAANEEALRQFVGIRLDCIVIDVPVYDSKGFELLDALRLGGSYLLIVLTNHITEEFKQRGLASGVNHFLIKSIDFEAVPDLVRALGVK